jgi:hypothetical protein
MHDGRRHRFDDIDHGTAVSIKQASIAGRVRGFLCAVISLAMQPNKI